MRLCPTGQIPWISERPCWLTAQKRHWDPLISSLYQCPLCSANSWAGTNQLSYLFPMKTMRSKSFETNSHSFLFLQELVAQPSTKPFSGILAAISPFCFWNVKLSISKNSTKWCLPSPLSFSPKCNVHTLHMQAVLKRPFLYYFLSLCAINKIFSKNQINYQALHVATPFSWKKSCC